MDAFCPICKESCKLNNCAFWHEHELTNGKIPNCGIASFMQFYMNNNERNQHGNHMKHYIDKAGLVMEERAMEDE